MGERTSCHAWCHRLHDALLLGLVRPPLLLPHGPQLRSFSSALFKRRPLPYREVRWTTARYDDLLPYSFWEIMIRPGSAMTTRVTDSSLRRHSLLLVATLATATLAFTCPTPTPISAITALGRAFSTFLPKWNTTLFLPM